MGMCLLVLQTGIRETHPASNIFVQPTENKPAVIIILNQGAGVQIAQRKKQGVYGYYHNRLEEDDNLYVISIDDYIKVGRSFNLKKRFYDIKRESGCEKLEMIYTLKGLHKDIYHLESRLHKELRKNGFTYKTTWSNETFLKEGLSLLRKYFEESNLHPIITK